MARDRSLKVEVPKPEQDRPELGRVGVIAAAGFVIGVAWPWLAGVKLVPSPPNDDGPEPTPAAGAAASAAVALPAGSAAEPAPLAAPAPARTDVETARVTGSQVTACRDGKKKAKTCDRVALDERVRPGLLAVAACPGASGARETLSIGMDVDFAEGKVTDVFPGKSTTFPKEKAKELVACVRDTLLQVKLDGVDHEHERYGVFYFVELVPPGTEVPAGAPVEEQTTEASGLATVAWDSAVVRSEPENGKVETRLRYGTRVVVTARRGKWYQVKYDARGSQGWVHQNALGL